MTAKEHYDHHLGNFYSWMSGDFNEKQEEQFKFFKSHNLLPFANKTAFDLGAGHGLQSIPLAKLGFSVKAVDFSSQLLAELNQNKADLDIQTIENDVIQYLQQSLEKAELIVCMGDTLTHLESAASVETLIGKIKEKLIPKGKLVLSFRDLTTTLTEENRFIPVRSDDNKILMCFLEYFPNHVMVHDILYERRDSKWIQKVSAYPKLRLSQQQIIKLLLKENFNVLGTEVVNRMIYIIAAS